MCAGLRAFRVHDLAAGRAAEGYHPAGAVVSRDQVLLGVHHGREAADLSFRAFPIRPLQISGRILSLWLRWLGGH